MRWAERGQALPLVIAAWAVLLAVVFAVFQLGRAHLAAARAQTLADLAAISAARTLLGGPVPLTETDATASRARAAALDALGGSGSQLRNVGLVASTGVPLAVDVEVRIPGPMGMTATAVARAGPALTSVAADFENGPATYATGGGYSGPLVYRDGKPMCPAVAAAFDLMQVAAGAHGLDLHITSGFRSDREQADLFAQNPDPKWVAPPGRSRHRDATELDIQTGGGVYPWLAANAGRFGFIQRYSWEPWHWGYRPGCGGGPAVARPGRAPAAELGPLPEWVPSRYRAMIASSARSAGIPPILLAALLRQESGFQAGAVSTVGALGIAQFMPATAAAVGLEDPRDPDQAVPAAARHLADLIGRLGSVELALAAYNAGEGAVRRYGGIPPFSETRAYVRAIVSVAGGAVIAAAGDDVVLMPVGERLTSGPPLAA